MGCACEVHALQLHQASQRFHSDEDAERGQQQIRGDADAVDADDSERPHEHEQRRK
jgi:hypothetical protein